MTKREQQLVRAAERVMQAQETYYSRNWRSTVTRQAAESRLAKALGAWRQLTQSTGR